MTSILEVLDYYSFLFLDKGEREGNKVRGIYSWIMWSEWCSDLEILGAWKQKVLILHSVIVIRQGIAGGKGKRKKGWKNEKTEGQGDSEGMAGVQTCRETWRRRNREIERRWDAMKGRGPDRRGRVTRELRSECAQNSEINMQEWRKKDIEKGSWAEGRMKEKTKDRVNEETKVIGNVRWRVDERRDGWTEG